jgi:hypothetical protein
MAGLLPKRRTPQEIERADTLLLRKHDAYFEAWIRRAKQDAKKQVKEPHAPKAAPRKTAR